MADARAAGGQDPTAQLLGLAAGFGIFQALHVAARLGIADALGEGEQSAGSIASKVGADPQSLYRLLRALSSVGVFAEAGGAFRNTPASAKLMSAAPGSLRGFVMLVGGAECWRSWGELGHAIRTGQPAFDHVFGEPLFEYLAKNPEPARVFDDAMAGRSAAEISALLAAYDFSNAGHLVDVGGGNGALLSAILDQYPQLSGTVFDLPHVTEAARAARGEGEQPRLRYAGGSFFTDVPVAGDTYLLKKVLHDWPDARAREILARCREAMAPDSRLLLIESVVPAGTPPTFMTFLDLWMLVWAGGKERTEEEYRALLKSAGLSLRRIVPTASPVCVIEAAPS
jgi:hypothetical protein